ncbi:hypothetical protein PO883_14950 [Massilia sp. DJPM01]|uniref:hypothetical protein n=1 Tax=Massilia sp. DJPM01 TaxID=3024404 RepID=UPI00259D5845|nr:hypothetical protein [Massilia sp. DJPM01]MDM5178494.1 hypothetical protein [Massilia sp. DJPM01]
MSEIRTLRLDAINILAGTQSRAQTSNATVEEYTEALEQGVQFPPVVVFSDGSNTGNWLADGFHRYLAHKAAGLVEIACDIRVGILPDAVLFSAGANGTHGLPRTNADKRSAVKMVLDNSACEDWSDRQIARHCKVSNNFVGDVRRAICHPMTDAPPVRTVQRGDSTYDLNTAKIGKLQADASPPLPISPTNTPAAAPTPSIAAPRPAPAVSSEPVVVTTNYAADDIDLPSEEDDHFDQLIEENKGLTAEIEALRIEVADLKAHIARLTQDDLARQVDTLTEKCARLDSLARSRLADVNDALGEVEKKKTLFKDLRNAAGIGEDGNLFEFIKRAARRPS